MIITKYYALLLFSWIYYYLCRYLYVFKWSMNAWRHLFKYSLILWDWTFDRCMYTLACTFDKYSHFILWKYILVWSCGKHSNYFCLKYIRTFTCNKHQYNFPEIVYNGIFCSKITLCIFCLYTHWGMFMLYDNVLLMFIWEKLKYKFSVQTGMVMVLSIFITNERFFVYSWMMSLTMILT